MINPAVSGRCVSVRVTVSVQYGMRSSLLPRNTPPSDGWGPV